MLKFSPSSLSDFKKSPLLFWLKMNKGIEVPRGAFPSLPGGMDRVLKTYYDDRRAKALLPDELEGKVPGKLFTDQARLKKWRFWKTGLEAEVAPGIVIGGALDDLLYDEFTRLYSMLDYKTRGAAPKPGATEEYYGVQADCYDLMLRANGMATNGRGYFAYYWPLGVDSTSQVDDIGFGFACQVVDIETDHRRASQLALDAAACISGQMPKLDENKEFDGFLLAALGVLQPSEAEPAATK